MKEIQLTQGKVALIDEADADLIEGYGWYAYRSPKNGEYYAQANVRRDQSRYTTIKMHRLIAAAESGEQVDHANHNGLDNRRSNLRRCTQSQNQANARKRKDSSGWKGVHFVKSSRVWRTRIQVRGRRILVGDFKNPEDAATAYNFAAAEHFGEFACFNLAKENQ